MRDKAPTAVVEKRGDIEGVVQLGGAAFHASPAAVDGDLGDDVSSVCTREDRLEHQHRERSLERVGRDGRVRPRPVLDEVSPTRSKPRENAVERGARRRKCMGRVIDDEIERSIELAVEDRPET